MLASTHSRIITRSRPEKRPSSVSISAQESGASGSRRTRNPSPAVRSTGRSGVPIIPTRDEGVWKHRGDH